MDKNEIAVTHIPESKLSRLLFADTRFALIWLVARLYVGWVWFEAGLEKVQNPAWAGSTAGAAMKGYIMGAIAKASGEHPAVQDWYAGFLNSVVIPNISVFSYLVAYGELLVGIALILGIFTGIAAFFGGFMNMNFLLAGTVSVNPILFLFELFLILAWRVAGWWGLDRYLLPFLGTPWQPGKIFKPKEEKNN